MKTESMPSLDAVGRRALELWASREAMAKLILDRDLALRWMNNAAAALLSSQKSITIAEGKLVFANAANRQVFQTLFDRATNTCTIAILDCGAPLGRVVAAVLALPIDQRQLMGVTLRSSHTVKVSTRLLREAFLLTKTECELVSLLLRGQTVEEAALPMQISVVTARTHIRNLYAKLDVSSREGMFSRLLPYLDLE